jgi:hypothetical protein
MSFYNDKTSIICHYSCNLQTFGVRKIVFDFDVNGWRRDASDFAALPGLRKDSIN